VLVEGKAIKIHRSFVLIPMLILRDQMAVHIPLSPERKSKRQCLMLSSNNILSPASGQPIAVPCRYRARIYYLTRDKAGAKARAGVRFLEECCRAGSKEVTTRSDQLRIPGDLIDLSGT